MAKKALKKAKYSPAAFNFDCTAFASIFIGAFTSVFRDLTEKSFNWK